MVSLFDYCVEKNIEFRIYKKKPFDFSEYFISSHYNWSFSDSDYENICESESIHIWLDNSRNYTGKQWFYQQKTLNVLAGSNLFKYIIIHYSSPYQLNPKSFKLLFKPSAQLKKVLDYHKNKINGDFISVSFRFVNLLSDSNEIVVGYNPLNYAEQSKLIDKNIEILNNIEHKYSDKKILITSDSYKFINTIEKLNNNKYYFIKADKIHQHIAFSDHVSKIGITKSYVEFLLISSASAAYQIQIPPMYESKFPKWAAALNNVPYYLIN
ncbi:MAG: hypothetical protein UFP03_07995 [Paludibacteraceae bacterium]|nr:hypothetical protein [Paludibacteraceae bacterium]